RRPGRRPRGIVAVWPAHPATLPGAPAGLIRTGGAVHRLVTPARRSPRPRLRRLARRGTGQRDPCRRHPRPLAPGLLAGHGADPALFDLPRVYAIPAVGAAHA